MGTQRRPVRVSEEKDRKVVVAEGCEGILISSLEESAEEGLPSGKKEERMVVGEGRPRPPRPRDNSDATKPPALHTVTCHREHTDDCSDIRSDLMLTSVYCRVTRTLCNFCGTPESARSRSCNGRISAALTPNSQQ